MKKIFLTLSLFSLMLIFGTISVSAEEVSKVKTIKDDTFSYVDAQKVLDDYNNGEVLNSHSGEDGLIQLFAGKRLTFKRGSWLAWSKGIVDWTYNGTKITASEGDQDSGWVYPNIVREKGITKMSTSTTTKHRYRHKTTIGAGTPTPWGDVKVYESSFTDYLNVYRDGSSLVN